MKTLSGNRVLLIGPGGIGRVFARIIADSGDSILGVIASSRASSMRHATELSKCGNLGFPVQAYSSLDKVAEREVIDGIIIAAPEHVRDDHLLQALELGIPLLCEKPLLSLGKPETNTLESLIKYSSAPFVFNAGNYHLFDGVVDYSCFAKSPEIFFRFHTKGKHRSLGIFADLIPHYISILQHLCGTQPVDLKKIDINQQSVSGSFVYGNHIAVFEFAEGPDVEKQLVLGVGGKFYKRRQFGQGDTYQVFIEGPLSSLDCDGDATVVERLDPFQASYSRFSRYMRAGREGCLSKCLDAESGDLSWAISNQRACAKLYSRCLEILAGHERGNI